MKVKRKRLLAFDNQQRKMAFCLQRRTVSDSGCGLWRGWLKCCETPPEAADIQRSAVILHNSEGGRALYRLLSAACDVRR